MANGQYAIHTHDSPSADTWRSSVSEKRILARERFSTKLMDRTIKGPTRWTKSVTDVNLAKFKNQFHNFRNHGYMTQQWHGDVTSVANCRVSQNLAQHETCSNQYRTPRTDMTRPTTHEPKYQRHPGTPVTKLPPVIPGMYQTSTTGNALNGITAKNSTSPQNAVDNCAPKASTVGRMPSSGGRDVTSGRDGRPSSGLEILSLGIDALALLERDQVDSVERTQKWVAECEFGTRAADRGENYTTDGETKPTRRVRFGAGDWLYKDKQFLFD
ncbi:hypothetical protein LSAT2_020166 [Lamellibrachia satsuma]|nr:hypothetical protein LSAT2_020166 [Lamellibrachia satsuma]